MRNLLIGDENVRFTDEQLDGRYLGEGTESMVYEYHGEAIKLYTDYCSKLRLDESTVNALSKLYTNRILLPKRIVRDADTGAFLGYTTDMKRKSSISGILRMQMKDFLEEIELITHDISVLNKANVDVEDFNKENTIYNGSIYLVDPGSFIIRTLPGSIRYISGNNRIVLNNYVKKELFGMVNLTKKEKSILYDISDDDINIADFIRTTAQEKESVRQYVKRLTR